MATRMLDPGEIFTTNEVSLNARQSIERLDGTVEKSPYGGWRVAFPAGCRVTDFYAGALQFTTPQGPVYHRKDLYGVWERPRRALFMQDFDHLPNLSKREKSTIVWAEEEPGK